MKFSIRDRKEENDEVRFSFEIDSEGDLVIYANGNMVGHISCRTGSFYGRDPDGLSGAITTILS